MRSANVWALALVALMGCGDEPPSTTGTTGELGGGGVGASPGGGEPGGADPGGAGPGGGGLGGAGGIGGAGGGTIVNGTAPTELNNVGVQMTGASYTLRFQLGRAFHQPPASGPTQDLICAAPTLADP
jgi:hypothetical protein